MTTATITRSLSFAGAPLSAWAFGIRIWVAVVVALAASFWLELEAPSTAALTVAANLQPCRIMRKIFFLSFALQMLPQRNGHAICVTEPQR